MLASDTSQFSVAIKAAKQVLSVIHDNKIPQSQHHALAEIFARYPLTPAEYSHDEAAALADYLGKDIKQYFAKHYHVFEDISDRLIEVGQATLGYAPAQLDVLYLRDQAKQKFATLAQSEFALKRVNVTESELFLEEIFSSALQQPASARQAYIQESLQVIAYPHSVPATIEIYALNALDALDNLAAIQHKSDAVAFSSAEGGVTNPNKTFSLQPILQRIEVLLQRMSPQWEKCEAAAQTILQEGYEQWKGASEETRRAIINTAVGAALVGNIFVGGPSQKDVAPAGERSKQETCIKPADSHQKEISLEQASRASDSLRSFDNKEQISQIKRSSKKTTIHLEKFDTSLNSAHQRTVKETLEDANKLSTQYVPSDVSNRNTKKLYDVLAEFIESSEGFMPKLTIVCNTKEKDIGFGHNCTLKGQKEFFYKVFGTNEVYHRVQAGGSITRAEGLKIFAEDIKAVDAQMRRQLNHHESGLYEKLPMHTRVGLLSAYYNLSLLVDNPRMRDALTEGTKSGNFEEAGQLLANTTYYYRDGKFTLNFGYGDEITIENIKAVDKAWDKYPGHVDRRHKEAAMVVGDAEFQVKGMSAARDIIKEIEKLPTLSISVKSMEAKEITLEMLKIGGDGHKNKSRRSK